MILQNFIIRLKFNILLSQKIKIKKYIFTIGAPRSGTTMLCQILNNHPNILMSNEDRTIDKILNKKIKFDKAVKQSNISAYKQFIDGYNSIQKFQNRWIKLKKKKLLDKENILISGDKKSGQNAEIFNNNKNNFVSSFKKPNIFFIHILRNPIAAAKSYEKSHPHETSNFDDALKKILKKNSYGFNLGKIIQKNYILIYYEDLLNDPEKVMKDVIDTIEKDLDNKNNQMWLKLLGKNFKQTSISETNYMKYDLFNILKNEFNNDIGHYKKYLY